MISVIVPIYNSEKYLEKCLESIRTQSFTDFECLMINDGSTDGTEAICKRYESDDKRFRYVYKTNGGSGSARNKGLEEATGEYIAFVDSDDYLHADYLTVLSTPLKEKKWDVVQCGMALLRDNNTTELLPQEKEYSYDELIKAVLKREFHIFLLQTPVTKLYRRELLQKNSIRFDEAVTVSEDCLFNTELLPYITSIKQISFCGYYYQQDNSTLTKSKSSLDKVLQSIKVGNITAGIRWQLIRDNRLENDEAIMRGFQTAVCIIYVSNAHQIETGGFTKEEKQKLYDSYFGVMDYPVDLAVNDQVGTDKQIVLASVKKDAKRIGTIYKLRNIKSKLRF